MDKKNFIGYVGTYTKADSEGIYTFTLDTGEGKIINVKAVGKVENPTYVAVSADNKFLYSVAKDGSEGGLAAFRVDKDTGSLTELNRQLTGGASPCHVSITKDNSLVISANYHKGTVDVYKTNEDGSLTPIQGTAAHEGHGPNKERQEKPHVHFSGFTPDEKYIVAVDLGTDKVVTYEWKEGKLVEKSSLSVRPGSGPRHIAFHPNGKYAYVMTELSSEVIALEYDAEDGSFKELQYISAIPSDFKENNQGSAIHISSDGKFVYVANRGHNSIAVFKSEKNGFLSFVEHVSTEGNWPRDFVLDPTENFVVASNEKSGTLTLYRRDKETGKLTLLQSNVSAPEAVCVKFMNE